MVRLVAEAGPAAAIGMTTPSGMRSKHELHMDEVDEAADELAES